MKRFFSIALIFLLLSRGEAVFAQGGKDKVETLRIAYITKEVELTSAEAEKFWPVYNEYNDKIKAIRRNLRQSYRKLSGNLSEKEAEQLYLLFIQSKQAEADVHKQYNEKLKGIIGLKKIVKLHVAEEEFRKKMVDAMQGNKAEGD